MTFYHLYWLLGVELVIVAYYDLKSKKISNLWSLFHLVLFIFLLFHNPKDYPFDIGTFYFSIVIFLVGFLFFVIKIMGAGDVKFLASFFLLIPLQLHSHLYYRLLLSTVIFGSILLVYNTIKNFNYIKLALISRDYKCLKKYYGTKFAFAPVILLSWILLGRAINIL